MKSIGLTMVGLGLLLYLFNWYSFRDRDNEFCPRSVCENMYQTVHAKELTCIKCHVK